MLWPMLSSFSFHVQLCQNLGMRVKGISVRGFVALTENGSCVLLHNEECIAKGLVVWHVILCVFRLWAQHFGQQKHDAGIEYLWQEFKLIFLFIAEWFAPCMRHTHSRNSTTGQSNAIEMRNMLHLLVYDYILLCHLLTRCDAMWCDRTDGNLVWARLKWIDRKFEMVWAR